MPKFLVDVTQTTVHTYEVEAESFTEAEDRYSDGIIIHSETSASATAGVHEQP